MPALQYSQSLLAVRVSSGCAWPASQVLQAAWPFVSWYVPRPHLVH